MNPPDEAGARTGARPSLMAASGASADARQSSILRALERPNVRPRAAAATEPRRRGRAAGWLSVPVLAAAVALAWSLYMPQEDGGDTYAVAPRSERPAAAAVTPEPPAPVAAAPAQEEDTAARIETIDVPGVAPPTVTAPEAPVEPVASAPADKPSVAPDLVQPDAAVPARVTKAPALPEKAKPAAEPVQRTAPVVTAAAVPAPPAPGATGSRGPDPEVDVVNALMRRFDSETAAAAATSAAPPPATAKVAKAKPEPAAPPPAPRKVEAAQSMQPEATCRISSMSDLLACKHRICQGRWGKTEACPMSDKEPAQRAANAQRTRN